MTMKDDRAAFAAERSAYIAGLAADRAAFDQARDLIVDIDRYKYAYLWTWLGAPIIQMPADIVATQEIIWQARPDIIVETGVARGGSLIFYASMLKLVDGGRVIGVDIDIRAHNRDTIEKHPMASMIDLVEGSSTDPETLAAVRRRIPPGAKVMVVLDSDHSRQHVLDELRLYGPLVSEGQYLVVADTMLGHLRPEQTPTARSHIWSPGNEPLAALDQYLTETDRFVRDAQINGKMILSSSPGGYCLCRAA